MPSWSVQGAAYYCDAVCAKTCHVFVADNSFFVFRSLVVKLIEDYCATVWPWALLCEPWRQKNSVGVRVDEEEMLRQPNEDVGSGFSGATVMISMKWGCKIDCGRETKPATMSVREPEPPKTKYSPHTLNGARRGELPCLAPCLAFEPFLM